MAGWQISAVHSDTVISNKHCSRFIFKIRVRWKPKQKRALSTVRSHSKPVRFACNKCQPRINKDWVYLYGEVPFRVGILTILTISWTLLINWALENPGFTSFRNSLHLQTSFFDFTLGSIPPGCFLRKAPTVSMQIYYTPGEEQMNNVDSFIQTGTSSIFRVESKFLFASLKDHSNCKPWPRRSVPPLCHTWHPELSFKALSNASVTASDASVSSNWFCLKIGYPIILWLIQCLSCFSSKSPKALAKGSQPG